EDVVVVELALADGEVVLLDLLLGALDALGDPLVGDDLALLHAELVHHLGGAVVPEEAHQVILERDVELALAGVALTAGAAAELEVDAAGLVALGAEDGEAALLLDRVRDLDVGAAPGHVGRDRDGALAAGLGDDLGLALGAVLPRVEDVVRDVLAL